MANISHMTHIIGSAEAARILGITRNGVNRRVAKGHLTPLTTVGQRARAFDRAEIERIAAAERGARRHA